MKNKKENDSILITEMVNLDFPNENNNNNDIENGVPSPATPSDIKKTSGHKSRLSNQSGVDLYEEGENVRPLIDLLRADSWLQIISPQPQHREKNDDGVNSRNKSFAGLGTLKGVLLPCTQNILGVILFLRLGFITAEAGVYLTSLIIILSVISTVLTTLSMSAIATNGKIQEGGPYYIISRNLGVEVGGAVGLLFYLGTSIAASMYVLGAIESFQTSFSLTDKFTFDVQLESLLLMMIMISIVLIGVKYVNMSSIIFFSIVILSIFCSLLGLIMISSSSFNGDISDDEIKTFDNGKANYQEDPDTGITPTFFTLLALFYPSTTGIMAGSNRSGVLKDPGRSIPYGTLGAITITTSLYLLVVWFYGSTLSNEILIEDKLVFASVSWPHSMVVNVGIIMSSIGAGLQSLTGAPRLLAAIANDSVIPFLKYFETSGNAEPKRAIIATWIIASLPCLAGNLDFVTPIVTMFFLLMYSSINLSCFLLSILRSPGFRPKWKYFHWSTALLGTIWCLGLMLVISWYVAIIAIVLMFLLLLYIKGKGAHKNWGNVLDGLKFQWARDSLLALGKSETLHAKNWRPQLLVLVKVNKNGQLHRPELLRFASQMKKGRGLLTITGVIEGDPIYDHDIAQKATYQLGKHMLLNGMTGFPQISICRDVPTALYTAINHTGVGMLRPNAVLCGWPKNWQSEQAKIIPYVNLLKGILSSHKAIIILKDGENIPTKKIEKNNPYIDIWWIVHDSGLLLLIPYLLSLHKIWKKCKLRLYAITTSKSAQPLTMLRNIRRHLNAVRITASVEIIDLSDSESTDKVYERTMDIRQRREILKALDNPSTMSVMIRNNPSSKKEQKRRSIVDLFPTITSPRKNRMSIINEEDEEIDSDEEENNDDKNIEEEKENIEKIKEADMKKEKEIEAKKLRERSESLERISLIQEIDEKRMTVALSLNEKMREESGNSELIVTNLPLSRKVDPIDFMGYVEAMTENLSNIVLIRGSGQEVVTTYG